MLLIKLCLNSNLDVFKVYQICTPVILISTMEATATQTPTSMLMDLRHLLDYFEEFRFMGASLARKIQDCALSLQKFIDLMEFVIDHESSCIEVYLNDLGIILENSNVIKACSTNLTVALNGDAHFEIIRKFNMLLLTKVQYTYKLVGDKFTSTDHDPESFSQIIKEYVDIGEKLSETDTILNIVNEVKALKTSDMNSSAYAAIVGPSFTGKTQTAFTLSHVMDVMYINLVAPSLDSSVSHQKIYTEFNIISRLFSKVMKNDIIKYDLESDVDFTATRLMEMNNSDKKFQTLGLIFILARWKKLFGLIRPETWFHKYRKVDQVMIPLLSPSEFRTCCKGKRSIIIAFKI